MEQFSCQGDTEPAGQKYPALQVPEQSAEVRPGPSPKRPGGHALATPPAQNCPGWQREALKNRPLAVGIAKKPSGVGDGKVDPAGQWWVGTPQPWAAADSTPVPLAHA